MDLIRGLVISRGALKFYQAHLTYKISRNAVGRQSKG